MSALNCLERSMGVKWASFAMVTAGAGGAVSAWRLMRGRWWWWAVWTVGRGVFTSVRWKAGASWYLTGWPLLVTAVTAVVLTGSSISRAAGRVRVMSQVVCVSLRL